MEIKYWVMLIILILNVVFFGFVIYCNKPTKKPPPCGKEE